MKNIREKRKGAWDRVDKEITALTAERDLLRKMVGLGANEILSEHKKYSKILSERNALLKERGLLRKLLKQKLGWDKCKLRDECLECISCGSDECIELHIKQVREEK